VLTCYWTLDRWCAERRAAIRIHQARTTLLPSHLPPPSPPTVVPPDAEAGWRGHKSLPGHECAIQVGRRGKSAPRRDAAAGLTAKRDRACRRQHPYASRRTAQTPSGVSQAWRTCWTLRYRPPVCPPVWLGCNGRECLSRARDHLTCDGPIERKGAQLRGSHGGRGGRTTIGREPDLAGLYPKHKRRMVDALLHAPFGQRQAGEIPTVGSKLHYI